MSQAPAAIRFEDDELFLLDQRLLPHRVEYLNPQTAADIWNAIASLAVRGAPAIGVAAAYGLARVMRNVGPDEFDNALQANGEYLKSARPTAVNLAWAVDQLVAHGTQDPSYAALKQAAQRIHADDIAMCDAIGEHGQRLITANSRVLTHCNAGSLATSGIGTATAPMYKAHAAGVPFKVYADETRPLYQGARLTAWELAATGIDVTLLCDNMAASLMATSGVDMVLVGTDRVAGNGDVVNKIGTLNLAILCKHYGVPFYVACPTSTIDVRVSTGDEVPIEQRGADEVRGSHGADVAAINTAFDVTPAGLVTGIITDQGLFDPAELVRQLA